MNKTFAGIILEETEKYRSVITRTPLFSGIDGAALDDALHLLSASISTYRRDEMLHAPYTRLERFGLVLCGSVKVCCDDIDGNRMLMADVQPGVTFGEALCFLGIENSPVYIYASRDTAVLWLCDTALHAKYKPYNTAVTSKADKSGEVGGARNADTVGSELLSALRESFTSLLCLRTLSMNSRIQTLTKLSIREKLLFFLSQACREAQSSDTKSAGTCDKSILGRPFEISMSRDDLAAYIGANRAAVSRELSRMKKDRLIDYEGNCFRLLGHD